MQTIVYDSRIKCFVFYRGGYDETTKKGIDPYKREFEPLTKERRYDQFYHGVADGFLLHINSISSVKAKEFFFGKDADFSKSQIVTGNWSICFDGCGRLVFYDASAPAPVRITKTLKTQSKFYKEWTTYSLYTYSDPWPREVRGWKFKKDVKYAIVDINTDYLFQLLPVEYEKLGFGKKSLFGHEEWLKRNDTLYALDPIDLNVSWDRTDDEKAVIKTEIDKIRAEKRAAQEDLERRRHTPGFCSVCGREGAEYVADPYAEEMYGEIHMEWLCPDCYHDAAMDV
jgi:hypothetical protein